MIGADAARKAFPGTREANGKTVALSTLGCKVNQVETEELKQRLIDHGYRIVGADEPADYRVINTCTVTSRSDFESRNLVRRAARRRDGARVIVTGCYAQREGGALANLPNVAAVVGSDRKRDIPALIGRLELDGDGIVDIGDVARAERFESYPISGLDGRARAYLKVQDGCRGGCSFCIVPSVKGPSRSRGLTDAVAAARRLVENGFAELVLCGIQLGYYGRDLTPPLALSDLLEELAAIDGLRRIRLSSLKPDLVDRELIRLVGGHPSLCRHLHLSLQSADDRVLGLMNREYDAAYLDGLLGRLVDSCPEIAIGADIIVGHPGETETSFRNTFNRIEGWPISFLHVFRYSNRPGTGSAELPDQVPSEVKKERSRRLRRLIRDKGARYRERFAGRDLEVLVESSAAGLSSGLSDNYLRVRFPGEGRVGEIRTVRIQSADSPLLGGVLAGP